MSRAAARATASAGVRRPRRVQALVGGGTAVIEPDPDRPYAATLFVDGTPQSHVDLADPTYLCFEYVQHIGTVLDVALPDPVTRTAADGRGERLRLMHLGGGAMTIPRYVAATRPGSRHRVAEIDGALVDLVRAELPIDPRHQIRVSTTEARNLLRQARAGTLDAVVVDVFSGARVPASSVTTTFFALVASRLKPSGVAVMNIVDRAPLAFARRLVATARTAFDHTAVAVEPAVWRGRRFGNLVLVAGRTELPLARLASRLAGGPFPARLEHGLALASFAAGAAPMLDAEEVASPVPPPDVFGRHAGRG